jgi:hypothetical protein
MKCAGYCVHLLLIKNANLKNNEYRLKASKSDHALVYMTVNSQNRFAPLIKPPRGVSREGIIGNWGSRAAATG